MSRASYSGPKLPQILLDQVGATGSSNRPQTHKFLRKDKRQTEQKRQSGQHGAYSTSRSNALKERARRQHTASLSERRNDRSSGSQVETNKHRSKPVPPKPILKRPAVVHKENEAASSDDEEEDEEEEEEAVSKPVMSSAVKRKLEEDDAEIAALEKKLGIKNKRLKALEEDGLDWIMNGENNDVNDDFELGNTRKTVEDDLWLKNKRRKADQLLAGSKVSHSRSSEAAQDEPSSDSGTSEADTDMDDLQNPFSDDELSEDDFGFSDDFEDDEHNRLKTRVRENPYIAPVTKHDKNADKYVPPSLRRAQLDGNEDLTQLKRQLQGQLNRLSDANFLSILQGIEAIYEKNARQHVSSTIIELLSSMVNTGSALSENFLILHAGFAVAIFKVIGPDFAAALLENFTSAIDDLRTNRQPGKRVLNLIGFLSNAYVLQMIGPSVLFDYIRAFLDDLSEDNTELLLRIVRTAGMQLRSDDPTSLKDIVLLLTRAVTKREEVTLSVRTKFMIETINDLKNNRMKTNVVAAGITSEHIQSMKKSLGTLNARALRATEPLQISLSDIRDSEKKGKWWLVGASYHDPAKLSANHPASAEQSKASTKYDDDGGYESETPGHVSLQKLARSQGMNTDVRRSIFTSIMSASDFEDAHQRIAKLNLKNKQLVEVPKVLLHCAGAENKYNPYYTIVARRLCGEKRLQKAFQSTLWDTLRKLDVSERSDEPEQGLATIINLGRLYGTLMSDNCLSLSSLKTVELSYPSSMLQTFAEVLLTTIMLRCSKQEDQRLALRTVFVETASAPGMIPGLRLFLENTLSAAEIANGNKERKSVRSGTKIALQTLSEVSASSVAVSDTDVSMSDEE